MSDLQKKQIIDVINKQLKRMYDDYAVLKTYGVRERMILGRAIQDLEATQEKIVEIFGEEN